jgi:hypothetical protein
MGVYQYAITKTKRIKGLSDVFGDIGVVEFRYKYSWSPSEKFEKYCARLDANIDRKWAGTELPILVTDKKGRGLSVWVGDSANWCDGENKGGEAPIGSSQGWDALCYWAEHNGRLELPLWLMNAGDLEHRQEIPFVPTTEQAYRELVDACSTMRLRQRGDSNAQPQIPNNRYWVNDDLCPYL